MRHGTEQVKSDERINRIDNRTVYISASHHSKGHKFLREYPIIQLKSRLNLGVNWIKTF